MEINNSETKLIPSDTSTETASETGVILLRTPDTQEIDVHSCSTETASETKGISNRFTSELRKKRKMNSRKRYFGDLSINDIGNPKTAKKNWGIISNTVFSLRKKIRNLQQTKRRLKSRIICLNLLMKYLRENTNLSESGEKAIQVRSV